MKKIVLFLILFINTITNAQSSKVVSSDWTSFTQSITIESKNEKKFKIEASVKVVSDDEQAWAGLWVRVDKKEGGSSFFDNMGDRPIKSNIWQNYTIEGTFDKNSKSLNFGGLICYNGKFFFDNFKLFIENEKGILEIVKISNGDFEKKIENQNIPNWSQGISQGKDVKIKEFKITSTEDNNGGNYALLIEGQGIIFKDDHKINPIEGTSPQIGTLISMLENLKDRVEKHVKEMSQYELDYLHDEKSNRIGSLIMHLAAAEKYYQVFTFENRGFNEEESKIWQVAFDLDEGGRDELKGHDAQYYLDIFNEVRAKTIAELKKRDDAWLAEVRQKTDANNHYCWFHVMEHQSSHLGQILFLKKRIPPEPEVKIEQPVKN